MTPATGLEKIGCLRYPNLTTGEGCMAGNSHDAHDDHAAVNPGGADAVHGGSMDLTNHVKTWLAFWRGVEISSACLIALAILLAIFRTHQ